MRTSRQAPGDRPYAEAQPSYSGRIEPVRRIGPALRMLIFFICLFSLLYAELSALGKFDCRAGPHYLGQGSIVKVMPGMVSGDFVAYSAWAGNRCGYPPA
jgi:hypothetical protein